MVFPFKCFDFSLISALPSAQGMPSDLYNTNQEEKRFSSAIQNKPPNSLCEDAFEHSN